MPDLITTAAAKVAAGTLANVGAGGAILFALGPLLPVVVAGMAVVALANQSSTPQNQDTSKSK